MNQLEGRTGVVIGAATGLGRSIARRFADERMTVVVADRRLPQAERTADEISASGGRAVAMQVDVTDRQSIRTLADRVDSELDGTGVLVNNAGVLPLTPILEPEEDNWRWIFDVNVFGVIYGLQEFLPRMLASQRECHVVSTASIAGMLGARGSNENRIVVGQRTPQVGMTSFGHGYASTKAAVIAIMETAALELSGSRVGVSVLVPGSTSDSNSNLNENSTTNRPDAYGGPVNAEKMFSLLASVRSEHSADPPPGGPPRPVAELADRVVHAIHERHFYIFTVPETRSDVERRYSEIVAGFDDAVAFQP